MGVDISFDVEMSLNFNSNIILVDPTPRAILHFNTFVKNYKYLEGNDLVNIAILIK